jgi:hypothetical protein
MFEHGEKCESLVIRGMKEETFQAERNNVSATLDSELGIGGDLRGHCEEPNMRVAQDGMYESHNKSSSVLKSEQYW